MNRPLRTKVSSKSLSLIGIPKKFHSSTINDFKDWGRKSLIEVKRFFADYITNIDTKFSDNCGLLIYGSNGVGKTFMSCLIAKEAYIHRYTTRRVTFVEYIDSYTKVWGARSIDEKEYYEQEFYNNYKAVEFLILEEVGKEIDSKVSAPILEDCLRYREDNGLVTIICTNLDIPTIVDRYGASVSSLMRGNMLPICIEGKDKRQTFFEERNEG